MFDLCLVADTSLTLLYKVKPGASDRSFGIHVAELAGMPAELVADARRVAEESEVNSAAPEDGKKRGKKRARYEEEDEDAATAATRKTVKL